MSYPYLCTHLSLSFKKNRNITNQIKTSKTVLECENKAHDLFGLFYRNY